MSVVHIAPPVQPDTPQPPETAAKMNGGSIRPTANRRRRGRNVPRVGDRITESGTPSLRAWASCLSLGDLETAVRKAAAA
jgi:hypothetical protein